MLIRRDITMKRTIPLLLAALLLAGVLSGCATNSGGETTAPSGTVPETTAASAPKPEETTPPTESDLDLGLVADKAFVYDVTNDEYIFLLGNHTDWVFPASTTKLFNAYVALQYLDPNEIVTVGEEITFLEDLASVAELRQGDATTVAMMIQCMLLPSGCDAAYTLAASAGRVIAGDPTLSARAAVDEFVQEMNRQARQLGMPNTHFVTPDGYHRSDHYISLAAFVRIGQLCLENETIMAATQVYEAEITFENGRSMTLTNLNEVINPDSIYYRPDCIGLKTGRTDAAGSCMLAAYRDTDNDRTLLIGVFGCPAKEDRYSTANILFDYFS